MKPFSVKLRTLLLCSTLYYSILLLSVFYLLIYIKYDKPSLKYDLGAHSIELYITGYNIAVDKLSIEFNGNINLIGTYYFEDEIESKEFKSNYRINDKVLVTGELSFPENNTIPNTFNYKIYLLYKNTNYIMKIESIELISSNTNIFYKLKNKVINIIDNIDNNEYLYAFILGNSRYLSSEVSNNYRINTVTHLFALSGLHVSIFAMIVSKLLKKLDEKLSLLIISIVLFLLCFITSFSPSILRATILFILINLNKIYYTFIKPKYLLYITFSIMIFINPYYIYNLGFVLSFTVTFFLILSNENINIKNKTLSTLVMSIISFACSIPIIINNFYKINIIGFINNLFFIPYVSYIVYPFSLLVFIFNFLSPILNILTNIMEYVSSISTHILNINIFFSKMSLISIILFYLFLILLIKYKKKILIVLIILLLVINNIKPLLNNDTFIYFVDVGQGDSMLIKTKNNKYILIDTGGKEIFFEETKRNKEFNLMKDSMIPFFNSIGITKIDYLFLTHGDADHMGESISLIENIKVENVIFNIGEFNSLELELIKLLNVKDIKYYQNIESINIDDYDIKILNTKDYSNENDNSIVMYLECNGFKVLLMGDAGIKKEKDILKHYNLSDIDIIKIGHHGSNTSSSYEFINTIKPVTCIISVGENNKFGHPKQSTLDNLINCNVYRTDIDGSIKIEFNKDDYIIKTMK